MFMFNHQRKLQRMPIRKDGVRTKVEQPFMEKCRICAESAESGDPYGTTSIQWKQWLSERVVTFISRYLPLSTGKVTTLLFSSKTTPVQRACVSVVQRSFYPLPGTSVAVHLRHLHTVPDLCIAWRLIFARHRFHNCRRRIRLPHACCRWSLL